MLYPLVYIDKKDNYDRNIAPFLMSNVTPLPQTQYQKIGETSIIIIIKNTNKIIINIVIKNKWRYNKYGRKRRK